MKKVLVCAALVALIGASALFAQSAEAIGKVERKGTTFTVFGTNGREITHFSSPNQELVGWGKDFFVLRQGTTFTTYDARCKKISNISVGNASAGSVQPDGFTVTVGTGPGARNQTFDKNCKRK